MNRENNGEGSLLPDASKVKSKAERGPLHAVIDKAPTATTPGQHFVVDLTSDEADTVRKVAARCGLDAPSFLEQFLCRTLPKQLPEERECLHNQVYPRDVMFACLDLFSEARIQRAAKFRRKTIQEYVIDALAFCVTHDEDDMIMHPQTGEPVADLMTLEELPGLRDHILQATGAGYILDEPGGFDLGFGPGSVPDQRQNGNSVNDTQEDENQ